MPGWSERMPGVPPKDMADYADQEPPLGYFARLEREKSLRRPSLDGASAAAPPVERARSLRAVLSSRQSSLPASLPADDPATPRSSLASSYGSGLATSLPGSAPAGSLIARVDSLRARARDQENPLSRSSWWSKMGSSTLNEKPDEGPPAPGQVGQDKAYVPQFVVAGNAMHYRGCTDEEDAPAVHATA